MRKTRRCFWKFGRDSAREATISDIAVANLGATRCLTAVRLFRPAEARDSFGRQEVNARLILRLQSHSGFPQRWPVRKKKAYQFGLAAHAGFHVDALQMRFDGGLSQSERARRLLRS